MNKKTLLLASSIVSAVLAAASVQAKEVTWTLDGVTFEDGATASGWFIYDAVTKKSRDFSITVTTGKFGAYTYNTADARCIGDYWIPTDHTYQGLSGVPEGGVRVLNLRFTELLTDAGGIVPVATSGKLPTWSAKGGAWECNNCSIQRFVTAGYAVAPVPEPETYALMLGGLGVLGAVARRRKARV